MTNIKCSIFSNDKLLGGSMRMKYQGDLFIKSKITVMNAQSLSILQQCFISREYVQVLIENREKTYLADCSIIGVSADNYTPLRKYHVLFGVEGIKEIEKENIENTNMKVVV